MQSRGLHPKGRQTQCNANTIGNYTSSKVLFGPGVRRSSLPCTTTPGRASRTKVSLFLPSKD
jgi:hypothetical protein